MEGRLHRRGKTPADLVEEVRSVTKSEPKSLDLEPRFEQTVSTGSTWLDLAISGGRVPGGGIPGGIFVEIFGPPSSGKTAILAEICASVQAPGGQVKFLDPEGRLDKEYSRIYGLTLPKDDYAMPDTVTEVFEEHIWPWKPKQDKVMNCVGVDSLAALSTQMEMDDKDGMGMRRAKEFSQNLRKSCRLINRRNWLIPCTNQVRQGYMLNTPGGEAIKFYSSLRIQVIQVEEITRSVTVVAKKEAVKASKGVEKVEGTKEVVEEKVVGVKSKCRIVKSSVDDPYREAIIFILFGYGLDDIRGNLQFVKDKTGVTRYDAITKSYQSMDYAIKHIEKNDLEEQLRGKVIDLWEEIEKKFESDRKSKVRR